MRPLSAWTDPITANRQSTGMFRASWDATVELLGDETNLLGAELVVIQIDADERDIRRDGMLRARARVGFPGVVVSFTSDYGPLRYATDTYEQHWAGHMPSWQANVRAIALALQALRAVDRYGVTRRAQQYIGFQALPAGPNKGFATADEAVAWMRHRAVPLLQDAHDRSPRELYRYLARRLHPDAGGDQADWERLDQARQLIERAANR